MRSKIHTNVLFILAIWMLTASIAFADDPPAWLRQAASLTVPAYENSVRAVVVSDEEHVALDSGGKLTTVKNVAVKILTREGRQEAIAVAPYLVNFGKVKEIDAWVIRPDGGAKSYGKDHVIDRIADTDDVYNEGRVKIIDASRDVDIGYVFGYSIVTEDRPLFYQDTRIFQTDLPVLRSTYSLSLPTGWSASSVTFNHAPISPQVAGSKYTWELRDLPPIADEPMSPSFINLVPRIAVNYSPPQGTQSAIQTFGDWQSVSKWLTVMHDPQVIVDDAVAAKARELTQNSKTEFERIQAIGSFVQNLQYISIDIGVGYGNGMKPRPSSLVLSRGYGDCKDKANLMRAMLKSLKIEAYPIVIYSGDPEYVRREWTSPGQFNHCIIAVKVSDETKAPTIINETSVGRLLVFDATDQFTPVGDLPDQLQGSLALLVAGENGDLLKMPVTPADFNTWNRETKIDLSADGSIKGVIRERVKGQGSTNARALLRSLSNSEFNTMIERWLTSGATGAQLLKITPADRQAEAGFDMDVEFSAARYGQLMQNRLLVFKPAIVSRTNSIYLTEKIRKHPVSLDSDSFTETATFTLPQGFAVDELPDATNLETTFGKYSANYVVKDNKLYFSRSLIMNRSTIPVEKYTSVRDFFSKMRDAEQAPVVLIKK